MTKKTTHAHYSLKTAERDPLVPTWKTLPLPMFIVLAGSSFDLWKGLTYACCKVAGAKRAATQGMENYTRPGTVPIDNADLLLNEIILPNHYWSVLRRTGNNQALS